MKTNPSAGKPADASMLVNAAKLVTAYDTEIPDPSVPEQRVAFGTSGHRGSAFDKAFNERHILAISQAICLYRKQNKIEGPLFLGMDTHALSVPAHATALEVLAANGVEVMIASGDEYTPTPAVSHAILAYNRGRKTGLADGIIVTPSHNPPHDGGFKYNSPNGGPAQSVVTACIEAKANEFLENGLRGVKRVLLGKAVRASTTRRHDYREAYISDLAGVLDMDSIRGSKLRLGVDPMGGAGVHYWGPIADRRALWVESHGRQRGRRPDLSFYDRGLGRSDPDGPLLALRHAEVDRIEESLRHRLRLRPRSRPPRDRQSKRRVDGAQPLPLRRPPLPLSASAAVAR